MPSVSELKEAFRVYFEEIERCRVGDCYWALLHVVVSLPDICAALESDTGWAKPEKYVKWCTDYLPPGLPTPDEYREIRDRVLHQGQTRTKAGRFYKFTKPTQQGGRVHRLSYGSSDVIVLDVGELAKEMVTGIETWFRALQQPDAAERRANVKRNLPTLVTVKEQQMPGISGITFNVTHTSTVSPFIRPT